ncbi:hypothetical protein DH2020_044716 [Rehmannia glutinosa]|uniref:Uncharacterized protein n=1 Tax=Rehmannia glutinosa TaxID=99300 RepID=A0ABR0UG55_REHGL
MAANWSLSYPVDSPACEKHPNPLQLIEEMTRNADSVQQDVLTRILTRNAQTEYLKGFNLDGTTDRETFKSKIPIVTYDDLQPYVKGLDKGKVLYFLFTRSETKTRGGIPARSAVTSFYRNDSFKDQPYDPYNVPIIPNEAIYCVDTYQSMYTQILCGLYEREHVLQVGATFASSLIRVIRFLQLEWHLLAHDIRTGSFNPKVTDVSIRERMTQVMRPNPELADFIARECAKDSWEGIIIKIWPNTKFIKTVVTGSMAQYIPTLDYYSGGLPLASLMYASSECYFGINLNPMCKPSEVSYTIMPNMAYFEFLPHEPNSPELTQPEPVDLANVEIDKEYEVVITTISGLCRYRVGDILRVTGFYNSVPQFQFVRRKNVVLSIDMDKTDETELQAAVENASRLLHEFNTSVVEYTSYADMTTIPGHYVIYCELLEKDSANSPSDMVLDQCCRAIEESLNSVYRRCRVADKSIGPLEIRVVKNGTFEELMDYAISKGASISQYKVSRCVSSTPIVDLLDSRVVSKHYSPSLSYWTS